MRELYRILRIMKGHWEYMSGRVSFVGNKTGEDAHQALLNIVGQHPISVEYYQRYTLGISHLWNLFAANGPMPTQAALAAAQKKLQGSGEDMEELGLGYNGMFLLRWLGYTGLAEPDILEKVFLPSEYLMKGPVVDDRPLSETEPVRIYTPPPPVGHPDEGQPGKNYLQWLIEAARSSHETLRKEEGFFWKTSRPLPCST